MDMSLLPLYHIFSVVAKNSSISAAAKELYISQPAVSKSIKKLEANLNTTLLYRNSRGISLTHTGELLYGYIHNAFETISDGEAKLKLNNKLGISHLKIGVSSTLCKHILLPYLKDFLTIYPHTQITIECQSTIHTLKLLENKEIDIGLIAKPENNKHFNCISVKKLHDIFVSTPQYIDNLLKREDIDTKHLLSKANLILLDKNNATRKYIDSYLNQWTIDSEHSMEVGNMELLIDFAKTGLGIACVIKEFITDELESGQLIEIATPKHIKEREVCFAYTATNPLLDSVKTFIDYIQNVL